MQHSIPRTANAGSLHQEVSTDQPLAQVYYDQGLAYLVAYAWIEAARSFHEAIRLDPELAMAYLGVARAYLGYGAVEEVPPFLTTATELAAAGKATPRETRWIALSQLQLAAVQAPIEERSALHEAYKQQIEEAIDLDRHDPHLFVLRGNAEERYPWGRGQMGDEESIRWYRSALRHDANHLGARHFLTHSYENTRRFDEALKHARRYRAGAAGVPHAHHMYGHILARNKRWNEALETFAMADALHRRIFSTGDLAKRDVWHFGHNLRLLAWIHWQLGDQERAEDLLREARGVGYQGWRGALFCSSWLEYLLLRGRFEEALGESRNCEVGGGAAGRVVSAALAAEALLELRRGDEAEKLKQQAVAALSKVKAESANSPAEWFLYPTLRAVLQPVEIKLALQGTDPEAAYERAERFAESVARRSSFDAWATGLLRVERLNHDERLSSRRWLTRISNRLAGLEKIIDHP